MLHFGLDIIVILMLGMIGILGVNVISRWYRFDTEYIDHATAASIYLVAWIVVMYTIISTIFL